MAFLDRFKPKPVEQRYAEILYATKARLDSWRDEESFINEYLVKGYHGLWDRDLIKEVDKIPPEHAQYYTRARFLCGVFSAIWAIQRKVFCTAPIIQGLQPTASSAAYVLELMFSQPDKELASEVEERNAVAMAMLITDHDVDIDVARDLGRAIGYPERPPLPSASEVTKDELFGPAIARVKLFWQHVVRFPLTPTLQIVDFSPTENEEIEVEDAEPEEQQAGAGRQTEVLRGGFGEPYCSAACYEAAGRAVATARLRGAAGPCERCQAGILVQHPVILAQGDRLVFICASCADREQQAVKTLARCYMCGAPLVVS